MRVWLEFFKIDKTKKNKNIFFIIKYILNLQLFMYFNVDVCVCVLYYIVF